MFPKIDEVSEVAENILKKRYYWKGESKWEDIVNRVVDFLMDNEKEEIKELTREAMIGRYIIPNSPVLVNSGKKKNAGLNACYVVDMKDTIEGIFKTKLDFALIAKFGGGCGVTLSKLRPKNSHVAGSTHGFAGGPVAFYDTICKDMEVMTQAGFRQMAMMGVNIISSPDILDFVFAKYHEGKMTTSNLSVMVDEQFVNDVQKNPDKPHAVLHEKWGEGYLVLNEEDGKYYPKLKSEITEEDKLLTVSEIFRMITDMAWRNGEPKL